MDRLGQVWEFEGGMIGLVVWSSGKSHDVLILSCRGPNFLGNPPGTVSKGFTEFMEGWEGRDGRDRTRIA